MRLRPGLILAFTGALVANPGCAAIYQTSDEPRVYGGTRLIARRWPSRGGTNGNPAGSMLKVAFNIVAPLDLPFSLVVDTLLLPFTGTAALADALASTGSGNVSDERAERLEELDRQLAASETADLHAERASLRILLGDRERGRRDLDRALALDPDHVGALVERADDRQRSGDLVGAQLDLDRAIELAPRHVWARVLRGHVRLTLGDVPGTVADWTRAEELSVGTSTVSMLPSALRERSNGSPWQELILQQLPHRRRPPP